MKKTFWDRTAKIYDRFMRKDHKAYKQMYALHIVPEPEKALMEIRRVLKEDGVLIAPTFTHAGNGFRGNAKVLLMKLVGFRQYSKWSSESYLDFLREQGWTVRKSKVLKASFPLTYAECVKG